MFVLRISFPAHRYHATPWGNHVNEGHVEWPPSPWRIIRAFCSVGFTHLGWSGSPPDAFAEIVESFALHPPDYSLPDSVETHSRHYMPTPSSTSKVLDTCRRISDSQAMYVRFDAELSPEAKQLLHDLATNTAYLGRAESWVDIQLANEAPNGLSWCCPSADSMPEIGTIPTRVLSPIPESAFQGWREKTISKRLSRVDGKPTKSQLKKANAPFPATIVDCVSVDTTFLSKHGWSQPPGSRWIQYLIPNIKQFAEVKSAMPVSDPTGTQPTTAILGLTSDSVSGRTLPPIGRALWVAEIAHSEAVRQFTKRYESLSYALSGKTQGSSPNKHMHAHFLPIDLDGDSKLDHLLVHCPAGLDFQTQTAIASIGRIFSKKLPEIAVTWLGCGDLTLAEKHLKALAKHSCKILTASKRFKSVTPYVASRHLRRKYQLSQNIADECRFRGLPEPTITAAAPNAGKFRLSRNKESRKPPVEFGQFLTIAFDESVKAPLTLGYGSHFGLGLFEAIDDT